MEILFKNSFEKTDEWIKECNKYNFFGRPTFIFFDICNVLLLLCGLYQLLFSHTIDLLSLFVPFWWVLLRFITYRRANKITAKRNLELNGNRCEVTSEFTETFISQTHSNGAQYKLYYDTIKRCHITKNYILLVSKANIIYSLKKDGFSIGTKEDFLKFLESKFIKVK